jgi:putative addiction module CopG family antidote
MHIDLTPEQQDFVRQAVESGRFARTEDAVHAALTQWVERERRRAEILATVDAARTSIARGEGLDITGGSIRAVAEDIKQRGRARFAAEHRHSEVKTAFDVFGSDLPDETFAGVFDQPRQ